MKWTADEKMNRSKTEQQEHGETSSLLYFTKKKARALLAALLCSIFWLCVAQTGHQQQSPTRPETGIILPNLLTSSDDDGCEGHKEWLKCCTDPSFPVLGGVDVVAYFQIVPASYAILGSPEFQSTLLTSEGEYTFYFSTSENKEYFEEDPWRYVPEYGGFDAGSVSPPPEAAAAAVGGAAGGSGGGGDGTGGEAAAAAAAAAPRWGAADVNQWAVLGGRLYLFRGDAEKGVFRARAAPRVAAGDRAWGQLYDNRWAAGFAPAPRTALLTRCAAAHDLPQYATAANENWTLSPLGLLGGFFAAAAVPPSSAPGAAGAGERLGGRGSRGGRRR